MLKTWAPQTTPMTSHENFLYSSEAILAEGEIVKSWKERHRFHLDTLWLLRMRRFAMCHVDRVVEKRRQKRREEAKALAHVEPFMPLYTVDLARKMLRKIPLRRGRPWRAIPNPGLWVKTNELAIRMGMKPKTFRVLSIHDKTVVVDAVSKTGSHYPLTYGKELVEILEV